MRSKIIIFLLCVLLLAGFYFIGDILKNYKGTNYKIKIADYDDSNVYGYSDYFSINNGSGTITITSPINSTSWEAGNWYFIKWNSTGTIILVDIETYKGNALKYSIKNVSNTGVYYWLIDEDIEAGTDWRIKIINSDDSNQYDWSDYFEIFRRESPGLPIPGYNYYVIISLIFIFSTLAIRRMKK